MILEEIVADKKRRLPEHMAAFQKVRCAVWQRR